MFSGKLMGWLDRRDLHGHFPRSRYRQHNRRENAVKIILGRMMECVSIFTCLIQVGYHGMNAEWDGWVHVARQVRCVSCFEKSLLSFFQVIIGGGSKEFWEKKATDVCPCCGRNARQKYRDELWKYQESRPGSFSSMPKSSTEGYGSASGVVVDDVDDCFWLARSARAT